MPKPLSILLVAHGYPPRESAGTERHAQALSRALNARGHRVHVLAATRAPGRSQYEIIEAHGVTRIVNNLATRTLSQGEADPIIDGIAAAVERRIEPDVVHVHHTQFLSSTMQFSAPRVVTLHDQWAWCPSGGLGLRSNGQLCHQPRLTDCASCHAEWRPRPSASARALTRAAAAAAPWIAPERLHRWYRRIPAALRPSPVRGDGRIEEPQAVAHRNRMVLGWFQGADALIAPSDHLAVLAREHGLGPIEVIRHGLEDEWFDPRPATNASAPFVHIGTVAHHKGTDLVVAAHRQLRHAPGLELYGPVLDPGAALGHRVGGVLSPPEVRAHLRSARALVLGSRWAENAPLIVIEARAVGCPVIAPDIGGIPELVTDGVDGFLYAPNSASALAGAMRRLLDAPPLTPTTPPQFKAQVDQIEALYHRVSRRSA
ncbi:MAG: glycosyltransferase [Myxococcota bacterium]|nr:glycosyltransferase [Myxococcota bacterium]